MATVDERLPPPQLDSKTDRPGSVSSKTDSLDSEQAGVSRVEAAQRVWGRYSRWILFAGLFLSAYIYSLEGYCAAVWNFRVTSAFQQHSLLTAIGTAQAIIISLGKIVFAKLADVFGRPEGFAASLFFYVLGFILLAAAQNIGTAAGGFLFYAVGYSGLQIMIQIVIADTTTLRYRGLTVGLFTAPFLINFAVGSQIAAHFSPAAELTGYPSLLRWGYGMFCIIFPVALAPIIITLFWGERKAIRLGYATRRIIPGDNFLSKARNLLSELDVIGLVLLVAGLGLILEPTALAGNTYNATISWDDAGTIAPMYTIGALCWPALFLWEAKIAKHPILPMRVFLNRDVAAVCAFGMFDFISFYLQYPYLASFITVATNWSNDGINYFLYTQTIALTLFAILFGAYIAAFKRYKWVIVGGLVVRLIGIACMIAARANPSSIAGLVITQLVQGIGGGIASVGGTVAAQAAVPHADVAIATALPLLFVEIGNAIGNSIAGAIWRNRMPGLLASNLSPLGLNQTTIDTIYGSAIAASAYPFGGEIRNAITVAYQDVMHTLLIVGTVMAVPPIFIALLLHNYKAGDGQNAVEPRRIDGEIDSTLDQSIDEEKKA